MHSTVDFHGENGSIKQFYYIEDYSWSYLEKNQNRLYSKNRDFSTAGLSWRLAMIHMKLKAQVAMTLRWEGWMCRALGLIVR